MVKRWLVLISVFVCPAILAMPVQSMAALSISESYSSNTVELTVYQDTDDIAGFAVGFGSLNMYDGTWIDNTYASAWEGFKVRKNSGGDWVRWTPSGDGPVVRWLAGWGSSYNYAHVFADNFLQGWIDYIDGLIPPTDPPDPLTYLTGSPIDGWFGGVNVPYSPFWAVRIQTDGSGTPQGYAFLEGDTSHAVPIPGAAYLLGAGLMGLFGLRRRLAAF